MSTAERRHDCTTVQSYKFDDSSATPRNSGNPQRQPSRSRRKSNRFSKLLVPNISRKQSFIEECHETESSSDSEADYVTKLENIHQMDSVEIIKIDTAAADPKTIQDYLSVGALITCLPGYMIYDSFSNIFAGKRRRPFRDALLDSIMGRCYRSSTLPQLRIMCGLRSLETELSSPIYWFGGATNLPNFNTEFKASGCAARWICEIPERRVEDPVLLYFHGGGYALKTCQPQIDYMTRLAKLLRRKFPRVSVLVLDYSIAPFARFPVQHKQALSCISALQQTSHNIIVMGDSCGGNLALSMLQEEETVDCRNLLGCMLISPWVDPASQSGSMNSKRDILSKARLNEMTEQFVTRDQLKDPRVSPILADPQVWQRVLPKNTACVWGDLECLADQSAEFQKIAKIENTYLEKNGTHDCILRGLKPKPCKYITEQLVKWIEPVTPDEAVKPVSLSSDSTIKTVTQR